MKKLNLPVIKDSFFDTKKHLSMDEYLKFVMLHLKYTFNEKVYKVWKQWLAVNVRFSLK